MQQQLNLNQSILLKFRDELFKHHGIPGYKLPENFSRINLRRCREVFNTEPDSTHILITLGEEAGEVLGALKKSLRELNPRDWNKIKKRLQEVPNMSDVELAYIENLDQEDPLHVDLVTRARDAMYHQAIRDEVADLAIVLDLLCTGQGINLQEAVRDKFNKVSRELGASEDFFI